MNLQGRIGLLIGDKKVEISHKLFGSIQFGTYELWNGYRMEGFPPMTEATAKEYFESYCGRFGSYQFTIDGDPVILEGYWIGGYDFDGGPSFKLGKPFNPEGGIEKFLANNKIRFQAWKRSEETRTPAWEHFCELI